jgi:hypothetical protein
MRANTTQSLAFATSPVTFYNKMKEPGEWGPPQYVLTFDVYLTPEMLVQLARDGLSVVGRCVDVGVFVCFFIVIFVIRVWWWCEADQRWKPL